MSGRGEWLPPLEIGAEPEAVDETSVDAMPDVPAREASGDIAATPTSRQGSPTTAGCLVTFVVVLLGGIVLAALGATDTEDDAEQRPVAAESPGGRPRASEGAGSAAQPTASMAEWSAEFVPVADRFVLVMNDISTAALSMDIDGTGRACRRLVGVLDDFERILPAPDPVVSGHLRTALSHYRTGAALCATGAENFDIAAITQATQEFERGSAAIALATTAVQR